MKEESLKQFVETGNKALTESRGCLTHVLDSLEQESRSEEELGSIQSLALVLQYRLDTQDALIALVHLDSSILHILGINALHPANTNLERMAFALGQDDLKSLLHALCQLIDMLLKAAYRSSQYVPSKSQKKQKIPKSNSVANELKQALSLQKQFISSLVDVNQYLIQLTKHAAIGPVLDHISALRGPISQFYQALQNGIVLSHTIYKKLNKFMALDNSLNLALQQAESILSNLPSVHKDNQSLFKSFKPATTEQLEQRAARKRTGHFFRY